MIISSEQLLYENRNYANSQARVQAMVKKEELIPLRRGLFEKDVNTPGFVPANNRYGVFTYRDVPEISFGGFHGLPIFCH